MTTTHRLTFSLNDAKIKQFGQFLENFEKYLNKGNLKFKKMVIYVN